MEKSNTQNQPADKGATVVAAATRERVSSLSENEAQSPANIVPDKSQLQQRRLLLKISEAAELLGISTASVRRLVARGELAVNRKLRHVLIPRTEIERFANGGDR